MRYLIVLLFLVGCTSAPLEPRPDGALYLYKADMMINLGDKFFEGFAWDDLKPTTTLRLQSKAALDLLQISSCHRTFTTENVDADWFGGVGHAYDYIYTPTSLESQGFCPIYIQAFDKTGTTSWGFVAFHTNESLAFTFQCNGKTRDLPGMGICQAQINQIQQITFPVKVSLVYSSECVVEDQQDGQNFIISSTGGFCLITARSKDDRTKFARIMLLGYKNMHVR